MPQAARSHPQEQQHELQHVLRHVTEPPAASAPSSHLERGNVDSATARSKFVSLGPDADLYSGPIEWQPSQWNQQAQESGMFQHLVQEQAQKQQQQRPRAASPGALPVNAAAGRRPPAAIITAAAAADLYDRNKRWAERVQQCSNDARRERDVAALDDCTFAPRINRTSARMVQVRMQQGRARLDQRVSVADGPADPLCLAGRGALPCQ
jgi:hypothetical protein